jgi:general transcription factor 3C polypeptide 4
MTESPLYTTLKLTTVSSFPSANCLQWNSDGQACLMTKTTLHILVNRFFCLYLMDQDMMMTIIQTPEPGFSFNTPSISHSSLCADKMRSIGWFRTMIEFTNNIKDSSNQNSETPIHWPDISNRAFETCPSSRFFPATNKYS